MRHWLFHPLIFYPLAAVAALVVIAISVRPWDWPRPPAPVAGHVQHGVLVLQGADFDAPAKSPEENVSVVRDFWGRARTMHVATLANQPPPTPAETGVRILLTPQSAALLEGKPVTLEVSYRPQPVNAAPSLAASLQGSGPANWVTLPAPPQSGVLRFQLPAATGVEAIGLQTVAQSADQSYGLEIVRIAAYPTPTAPAAPTSTPATPAQSSAPPAGN